MIFWSSYMLSYYSWLHLSFIAHQLLYLGTYPDIHVFAWEKGGTTLAQNASGSVQNINTGNDFVVTGFKAVGNEAGGEEDGNDTGNNASEEDSGEYDNGKAEGSRKNDVGVHGGVEGLRERGSLNDEVPEIDEPTNQDEENPSGGLGLSSLQGNGQTE